MTCTFLCAVCTINAQQSESQRADSLFRQRAYFEASIEYERILFGNSQGSITAYTIQQKIQCLKQQKQFAQAITFIRQHLLENLPDSISYQLYYEQVLCAYLGRNFENALSIMEQMKLIHARSAGDARLLLIRILSLNELQQWDQASRLYDQFMQQHGVAASLSPYKDVPRLKSKDRAQWLSTFIPGGGQLYAGKPLEALVTIVIQGAAIYFGIVSFQQHYYVATWLVGAGLFGSFHMGGVRRSEVLVEQYNQKKIARFNQKVRELLLQEMQ